MIYHIATEVDWTAHEHMEQYAPSAFKKDGFIHCSTKQQVERIANTIFMSHSNIILLSINEGKEKDYTRYENLEGGIELFPHIYRKLPKSSIEYVTLFHKTNDEGFHFNL